jgi:hypothetical protein
VPADGKHLAAVCRIKRLGRLYCFSIAISAAEGRRVCSCAARIFCSAKLAIAGCCPSNVSSRRPRDSSLISSLPLHAHRTCGEGHMAIHIPRREFIVTPVSARPCGARIHLRWDCRLRDCWLTTLGRGLLQTPQSKHATFQTLSCTRLSANQASE